MVSSCNGQIESKRPFLENDVRVAPVSTDKPPGIASDTEAPAYFVSENGSAGIIFENRTDHRCDCLRHRAIEGGPAARRLGFPLVHPFDQSLDRFISRYCILPAPYVPQTTSAKPVDGIQRMQRIDENCQVGLAGVARTDEDGEWAQIDFRSRNRAEVGNRQSDGLATFWLAHVPAVYPTTRAAATVRRLRCGQPWGSPSHASKSAVSCRRLARARRSRSENGEVL